MTCTPEGIDYISRLEELVAEPPSFEDFVAMLAEDYAVYRTQGGFSTGINVHNDHECAVQKYFARAGLIFPTHVHQDEDEYCIILQGKGSLYIEGKSRTFEPLFFIHIASGLPHSWFFEVDTRLLAITIPASKGFPGGKQ